MNFRIDLFPKKTDSYNVPAFTEGTLSYIENGEIIFELDDILLVEFALALNDWIKNRNMQEPKNFYYASMNYEEEPIVAFIYDEVQSLYKVRSVFYGSDKDLCSVSENCLINDSKNYLNNLVKEINKKFGFDLNQILKNL